MIHKTKVEIHKDNRKYGIEFTINKTIPEFNKGAEKCDLNWVRLLFGVQECAPGPSQNSLETGAS